MRTIDPILKDALANQKGETIIRVLTWTNITAYNAAPTEGKAWTCEKYSIFNTSAEATIISPDNSYSEAVFDVFTIERGVSISGTEYTVKSGLYYVRSYTEISGKIKLEGSTYPNIPIVLAGDTSYQDVINQFCAAIGKTATFKDPAATWLEFQFLPDGKQVVLNKAERFENLIKQKYTIGVYERSPKELVFYVPSKSVSSWSDINSESAERTVLIAAGGTHKTVSSLDGTAWKKNSAPSFTKAIAYSDALNLYVAVGNSACMSSDDGENWTSRSIALKNWTDVTWFSSESCFIAISINGEIARSSDGKNWTTFEGFVSQTPAAYNQWNSITYSQELSLYVAVASNGTNRVMTSPNGEAWTARTAAAANQWHSVCWSVELALFVAVSIDGDIQRAMTSPDGINWTIRNTPQGAWRSVCWSPTLSLFCAVSDINVYAMTSPDGINWTQRTAPSYQWYSVCWSNSLSLFCAVNYNGTESAMTSPDGITWTTTAGLERIGWLSVCWAEEISLFCAVAYTGLGLRLTATSPDGINWEAHATPGQYQWRSVCWAPEINLFIAVGSWPSISAAMTSPDGITWTTRRTQTGYWYGVCWSSDQGKAVAVSYTGQVMTSTNLSSAAPPVSANLIHAHNSDDLLVAIGTSVAYTSTDGYTWVSRSFSYGTYYDLKSNGSLYIAIGYNKCMTSPDGITWTSRTIPAGSYYSVCWSQHLAMWVAVGLNAIITSPDGITWTSNTSPVSNTWKAITWNDSTKSFIMASSDGEYRIALSQDAYSWTLISESVDFSLKYENGTKFNITKGLYSVHYIWRDEEGSINQSGVTNSPAWNLGFLKSTDAPPSEYTDPYYKFHLIATPTRLDITDGDRIHFSPAWILDPSKSIDASITIEEHFDPAKYPVWYQDIRSLALFEHTEGGALPSTIERVAAYTPLVSSGFDGNLSPEVNNLQALAQAVDDLDLGGASYTPPATTAANDFQVGDGIGAWITKTLAQTVTILRTALDSVYSLVGHTHTPASLGVPSGSGNSTGTNTGDQTNISGYADGATKWLATGYLGIWYASHTYTYIAAIATTLWRITTNHSAGVSVYHADRVSTGVPYGAFLGGNTIPAWLTYYAQPYGTLSTAAWIVTLPQQGTMRNLVISTASAQPAVGGGLIVTLTKNGVATAITVTIPPGGAAGRYSDTINSISWAFGDFLGWNIANSSPSASAVIVSIGSELQVT